MKKLNNKGYMLVEIILAFAIAFAILYFMMDLVIKLKNKNDDLLIETIVKTDQGIITNRLMGYIVDDNITFSCDKIKADNNGAVIYDVDGDGFDGDDDDVIDIVDDTATISYNASTNCEINEEKVTIRIPIKVKQLPDSDFDVIIDYVYRFL